MAAARLEAEGGVRVAEEACNAAVSVGRRGLRHRFFPAKAVCLLEDVTGRTVAAGRCEVSAKLVRETAAVSVGVPLAHSFLWLENVIVCWVLFAFGLSAIYRKAVRS